MKISFSLKETKKNKQRQQQQKQKHQQPLKETRYYITERRYETDSDCELEIEEGEIVKSEESKDKKPKKEKYKKRTNK